MISSTSMEDVMSVNDQHVKPTQTSFLHQPFPEAAEKPRYQHEDSPSFNVEKTVQMPDNYQNMAATNQTEEMMGVTNYQHELEYKANKSCFNMEQLLELVSRTEDLNTQTLNNENAYTSHTESPTMKHYASEPSGNASENVSEASNVKEEKRVKKMEVTERGNIKRKKTEEIDKRQNEAQRMLKEVSRSRSKFNGNRGTLPAIGSLPTETKLYRTNLPDIKLQWKQEFDLQDNNIIDVIEKHETRVREDTYLRELSQGIIDASVYEISASHQNETINIIEKHEQGNSKMYEILNGNYTVGHLRARGAESGCEQASAESRCSSSASRRGAA